jgi:hypothetical protein
VDNLDKRSTLVGCKRYLADEIWGFDARFMVNVLSSSLRPRRRRRPLQGFVIAELHTNQLATGVWRVLEEVSPHVRSMETAGCSGIRLAGRCTMEKGDKFPLGYMYPALYICIFGWICMELCGADLDSSSFAQNHRHGWLSIRLAFNVFRGLGMVLRPSPESQR